MNVVPAQVAGVRVDRPGQLAAEGPRRPAASPTILAACALLGVDEVYAVGGAQAIAMFAYGAGECEPVDLVTGPGNIYTVAAKRLLKGVVGIDSEAGPTEIAILADDSADAAYVAADLISQAEHDPLAASVLVTSSRAAGRRRRGRARQAGLRHPPHRPDPDRPRRAAVGHRARRRRRAGTGRGRRLRRRAPRDPDPRRGRRGRPGAQRRRDLRRAVRPGLARRLLRRLQPRAADGRLRLPLLGAVGARVPQGRPRRRLRPRRAAPRWPTTWSRSPARRTCPGHGEAVTIRFGR